ncbi:MAG: hypothetical protein KIT22_07785 [Verrucomicrobiae bacterium]|nr:hypothetical protein [Verrucomicrobiae bacterium]
MEPITAITAVNTALQLLALAAKLREEAIRKNEWTPEQESAYRASTRQTMEQASHWQLSGRARRK